jgi:Tol biopolymer transport system component
VEGNGDIWLLETARGVTSRLMEPTAEYFPTWSPDGTRLAFSLGGSLYERPVAGGEPSHIFTESEFALGSDWSADGRHLLYHTASSDLWVLPLERGAERIAFADTESLEVDGAFSPNGDWIAYTSDESGELQVYVRRLPGSGGKLQVSTTVGGMARWRGDGRELFYVALDGKLMAVPLQGVAGRDALQALEPVPLFDARVGAPYQINSRQQYMVAPDGKRFLLNAITEEVAPPITVVVNWKPGILKPP